MQPPGKKGSWLKHLSDGRLVEVYYHLEQGAAAYSIAKKAQDEWGIMTSSQTGSLARSVRAFRDKAVPELKKIQADLSKKTREAKHPPAVTSEVKGKLQKRINKALGDVDVLEVKTWAVVAQQARVMLLIEKEDMTGVPFKFTDNSMKVLNELTNDLLDWQVKLGLRDCVPNEFNVKMKHQFAGVMAETVSHDKDKVVKATERFIELIDEKSLTLQRGDNGTFAYSPKRDDDGNTCTVSDTAGVSDRDN